MRISRHASSSLLATMIIIIVAVPLIKSQHFFPEYNLVKMLILQWLVAIAAVIYATIVWNNPACGAKRTWLHGSLALFILISIVAALFGENSTISLWGMSSRYEGVVQLFFFYLAFLLFAHLAEDTKKMWFMIRVSLVTSVFVGFVSAMRLLAGTAGASTTGITTFTSTYFAFHIFFALWHILEHRKYRTLLIALLIFQGFLIFELRTRGVLVGLNAGLILSGFLIFRHPHIIEKKYKMIASALFGIFLIASIAVFSQRFTTEGIHGSSIHSRVIIWEMALNAIQDRPLLGWGRGNFPNIFETYYNPELLAIPFDNAWWDSTHNIVIEEFLGAGIVGGMIFLLLFASAFFHLIKHEREFPYRTALLAGTLSMYFVAGQFNPNSATGLTMLFFTLGLIQSIDAKQGHVVPIPAKFFAAVLTIGVLGFTLFGTIPMTRAGWHIRQMDISIARMQFDTMQQHIAQLPDSPSAYSTIAEGAVFSTPLLHHLATTSRAQKKHDDLQQMQKIIQKMLRTAQQRFPGHGKYLLYDANLSMNQKDFSTAVQTYEKFSTIAPNRQLPLVMTGEAYNNSGDFARAEDVFKKAIALAPDIPMPLLNLGLFYIQQNRTQEAQDILTQLRQQNFEFSNIASIISTPAIRTILSFALSQEDHTLAYHLYSALYNKTSKSNTLLSTEKFTAQDHINFAIMASKVGNIGKAREQALKAVELDPTQQENAQKFLDELHTE